MKASKIYSQTIKFVWMKLGLGVVTILLSAVLLGICTGIAVLVNVPTLTFFLFCLWIIGTAVISNLINHYFGYLVKAGHVAIVATAVQTGQIPNDQFNVAKQMVKERFITGNVYFVIDRLISGAVKQLQNGLDKVDNLLGNIPGLSAIISFAKIFIGIALGYIDECCLGYTFLHKEDSAFKSAADGVVIYFQNWKVLLKNALKVTLIVIGSVLLSTALAFALIGGLFSLFDGNMAVAIILSLFVSLIIKSSFIDSYMMVSTMVKYGEVAPQTEITFDLYGKLCNLSKKFKDLFTKGQEGNSSRLPV